MLRQGLQQGEPVPAARGDEPQQGVAGPGGLEQRPHVIADRDHLERQAQIGRRALHPGEVVGERERPAAVQAQDLEHAVPPQQAVVGHGDARLLEGKHPTIQACQLAHGGVGREGLEPSTLGLRGPCSTN